MSRPEESTTQNSLSDVAPARVMLRPAEYRQKLFAEIERRRNDFRKGQLELLKRPSQAALQTPED